MIRKSITVEDALAVLNRAFEADPEAMDALRLAKVPCNKKLGNDPEIQVGLASRYFKNREPDRPYAIGFLGVVNGLFGIDEATGYGAIAMSYQLRCPSGCDVPDEANVGDPCGECGHRIEAGKFLGFKAIDHEDLRKRMEAEDALVGQREE